MCKQQCDDLYGAVSTFEAVTRQMVETLSDDVRDIRNSIQGLFWLIAGTVVIDLVLRVGGFGG